MRSLRAAALCLTAVLVLAAAGIDAAPSPTPASTINASSAVCGANFHTAGAASNGTSLSWQGVIVLLGVIALFLLMAFDIAGALVCLFGLSTFFTVAGIITTADLFSGLVNHGMLAVCLLFVLVHPIAELAIARTFIKWLIAPKAIPIVPKVIADGVVATVGAAAAESEAETPASKARRLEFWARVNLCLFGWIVSPLLENTPHVAVLTPVISSVAHDAGLSISQLLMPMSFLICSSNWLMTGSASNLILQSLMEQANCGYMGFFELAKTNFVVSILLMPYCFFVPKYILPLAIPAARKASTPLEGALSLTPTSQQNNANTPAPSSSTDVSSDLPPDAHLMVLAMSQQQQGITVLSTVGDVRRALKGSARLVSVLSRAASSQGGNGSFAQQQQRHRRHGHAFVEVALKDLGGDDAAVSARDLVVVAGDAAAICEMAHLSGFDLVATAPQHYLTIELAGRSESVPSRRSSAHDLASGADDEGDNTVEDIPAMPLSREFVVVSATVSNACVGVGQRLRMGTFTSRYGCAIIGLRTEYGERRLATQLGSHVLQAGDTVLFVATHAFMNQFYRKLTTDFYVVSPVGDWDRVQPIADSDAHGGAGEKWLRIPSFIAQHCACCAVVWEDSNAYLVLPSWWCNTSIAIFLAVVVAAADEVDLVLACAIAICVIVSIGVVGPKEAIHFVDWHVYITGSMAFGVGVAMTKSGLAAFCGHIVTAMGLSGFWLLFSIALVTAAISNLVSNKGAIQVIFPIALSISATQGVSMMPIAVTIANAAMGGFMTPYGSAPSLIIAGPGGYQPKHYLLFGGPLTILYALLSAGVTTLVYGS